MANMKELAERFDWAEQLKPGDRVAVALSSYGYAPYLLLEVARVTPAQIVTKEGHRFAKRTLYEIGAKGSTWRARRSIEPVTPFIEEKMETYRLVRWLDSLVTEHGRKHPPLHLLRAMKAAYDKAGEEHAKAQGLD